jgi:hypothetical protein
MKTKRNRITCFEANPEGWSGLTRAIYKGKEYKVMQVHFEEDLVAINEFDEFDENGEPKMEWKRIFID